MGEGTIQTKTNGATTMTNTRPRIAKVVNPQTTAQFANKDQFVQSSQDENRVINEREAAQVVDGDNQTKKSPNTESSTENKNGLTPQQHRVVKGDTVWALLRKRGFSNQEIARFALAETATLSKLKNPNLIYPGDILTFPERKSEAKTEQKTSNQSSQTKTEQAKTEQQTTEASKTVSENTKREESTEVTVVDISTIEAKDQMMAVVMPKSYDSREIRNGIMTNLGFSPEDIEAFDKRYPEGFYIANNQGTTWATPAEMKTWKVNEYGGTEIELKGKVIALLKAFYAERYPNQKS